MIALEVIVANTQAYNSKIEQKKGKIKLKLITYDADTLLEQSTLPREIESVEYALQVYYLSQ